MLNIHNLEVKVDDKIILSDINLQIKEGQILFLMGKNGSGKSTLAQAIMGNPSYNYFGQMILGDKDLLQLPMNERSNRGIFVSFQNPVEVSGVNLTTYLKEIINTNREANYESKGQNKLSAREVLDLVKAKMELLNWDNSFLKRNLNEGMSGGEKKKSEILQMLLLDPTLIVLDEIDSGLDVKALGEICSVVKSFLNLTKSLIVITHNPKILDYITPDQVVVLDSGKIKLVGESALAKQVFDSEFKI
jgi:Fe-S cluster assembly ATP-binding protein